ncbi:MAG TPA: TIGR01777 family oxidoreductase [Vicinamibacterales bacterium]|nr:TIGR01777 family oxidoreductase [Vicinamibacterales bacterium]
MRIVIAGGTGFLGSALSRRLAKDGHTVVVLTRDSLAPREPGLVRYASWTPDGNAGAWARELDGADAIVNLAGAGIADKRWSASRKQLLRQSRILSTRSLVNAIRVMTKRPTVMIQGSAEGYYGAFETGPTIDESFPPGSDFLANLCAAWEAEAQPVAALGVRLVLARTSVVLSRNGGALKKMIPPFKAFVGGPLGTGKQFFSWIHLDDWVGLNAWAIGNPEASGPINFTAPGPVTNGEFSHALARALGRPCWLPVPPFALRIIVGEMAGAALLLGHRILPTRAITLGYKFQYERIDEAMAAAVK